MKAVYWAVTLVAAGLLIPFALSNRQPVSLGFWPLPFLVDLPLYLLVLSLLLAGFVIGAAATWIAGRRIRRDLRRRRRRVEALERELRVVRSQLEDQAGTERSGVPA
jgi:lipopolysaccharide assembly protein A